MATTVINFKDQSFQTTDLPQQIQQTVMFYDAAIASQQEAEIKLVIASSASKHLLSTISTQVEQWQAEVEAAATSDTIDESPQEDVAEEAPVLAETTTV